MGVKMIVFNNSQSNSFEIISCLIQAIIAVLAYTFSVRDKRDKYKREIREYYSNVNSFFYTLKCYLVETYNLEIDFCYEIKNKDNTTYNKLVNIYRLYNQEIDKIKNCISQNKYNTSIEKFLDKYPIYRKFYEEASLLYNIDYRGDIKYIYEDIVERKAVNVGENRLKDYFEKFKSYENKLDEIYEKYFLKKEKENYIIEDFEKNLKDFISKIWI